MARNLSPVLTDKVSVIFPARHCSGLCSDLPHFYWTDAHISTVNLSDVTLTDPEIVEQPLGTIDTTWTVRDTCQALYTTAAGSPSNLTQLNQLAAQIAQDYYDWRSVNFDVVYNGVAPVDPCALIDLIEFRYDKTDSTTRVQSAPWTGEPTEYQHMDPGVSSSGCQGYDRYPGMLIEMVVDSNASATQGVLSLEDGRLVMRYESLINMSPCGTTVAFSGTLLGCTTPGVPGTITITSGMTTLYSGSTNSTGFYSGTVTIASDTSVVITGTPTSARLAASTITRTLHVAGGNTNLNLPAVAASGYRCTATCNYPIGDNLTFTQVGGSCAGHLYTSGTLAAGVPAGFTPSASVGYWSGTTTYTDASTGFVYDHFIFSSNNIGTLQFSVWSATHGTQFIANPFANPCPTLTLTFSSSMTCGSFGSRTTGTIFE